MPPFGRRWSFGATVLKGGDQPPDLTTFAKVVGPAGSGKGMGQKSHENERRIRPSRALVKSVGVLTLFVGGSRSGKNAWCCESCRRAALRHGHAAPTEETKAPGRQQAQTASELRLSQQPAP
jgi:hypothetical protein